MSRLYIILLGIAAFCLAATGAYFSVFGLGQLFSGATKSVVFMASVLEFSKLVSAGFLYRYWGHIHHVLRVYLAFAVFTLVCITSTGIYGYLSAAYQQSAAGLHSHMLKQQVLEKEAARYEAQIKEFQTFIDKIPASRVSRKFEFQRFYDPQVRVLQKKIDGVQNQIATLKLEMLTTQRDVGPIVYTAETLGLPVDTVARLFILVFVLVFDPLAITLVFCFNLAVRLQEKYRGREDKIAAHAMMGDPVDHRYRKAG